MEGGNMGFLSGSGGSEDGGGGGRVPSGGSTTGSMSTITNKDSSEVSSDDLELGLGLSLGGGGGKSKPYPRILTAKDFPNYLLSNSSSSSSPSPSPSIGTKRTASDSVSPPPNSTSQVVGWPPVRAYRMNNLINQLKQPNNEEFSSKIGGNKIKNSISDKSNVPNEKGPIKNSLFVKINMDGTLIGRKVDLNAHTSYESLAATLNQMFARRLKSEENGNISKEVAALKLLDGSSEFVLTYEDKEGDWMLVGDVPWRMFRNSVKRLRIMRTSEANGLAPSFQEKKR